MYQAKLIGIFIIAAMASSCEENKEADFNVAREQVNGYVQKGPYLNGTAITVSELTRELTPTGKNFSSQIMDNKGTFEVKNVDVISPFVELKADGFYFNEVTNENSTTQLTLFALSDLTEKSSLNVNILSSLEKSRIDYLVSNGISFSEAKRQAQREILAIFEITNPNMLESELLDITQSGDDHAILLAVSVILQGYLPVSDLSELLANISTDIQEDGVLDSQTLGSTLINNAKALTLYDIRENLEKRYQTLGLDVTIPPFEKYVQQFIDSTAFEFTAFIEYPVTGKYGSNLLDKNQTEYEAGTYSMKAILPEGTDVQVKISGQNWFFPAFQENTGWEYSSLEENDNSRIFSSTRTGEIDFEILLGSYPDSVGYNTTRIQVFEDGRTAPTRTKVITVE